MLKVLVAIFLLAIPSAFAGGCLSYFYQKTCLSKDQLNPHRLPLDFYGEGPCFKKSDGKSWCYVDDMTGMEHPCDCSNPDCGCPVIEDSDDNSDQGPKCLSELRERCLYREELNPLRIEGRQWASEKSPCFAIEDKDGLFCYVDDATGMEHPCTCKDVSCDCEIPVNSACNNEAAPKNPDCTATKDIYSNLEITAELENGTTVTYENTQYLYCGVNATACNNAVCNRNEISKDDQQTIVDKHNELRRFVASGEATNKNNKKLPPAADMHELSWDDELAKGAQLWADQCQFGHDDNRATPDFPKGAGQNIYKNWGDQYLTAFNYTVPIIEWFREIDDWPVDNYASFTTDGVTGIVGHFTAIAWAATTKIGCGSIGYYDDIDYIQLVVCNYGEAGNVQGRPMYTSGKAGSKCQNGQNDGLCK